ncbi:MAG: hypothetical protein KatS3mg057_0114 [Herpetosiphonaceae bacterium]|nr:MAG: hypothetical protein KatS3mg057_0114 [Herpetosiphonaceae bacterium]
MSGADIFSHPAPAGAKRIAYGRMALQFGDLRLPAGGGPFPVVIMIHGGFWRSAYDLEHTGHLCAALTDAGVATWNIEYRRVGNPGGGWPGTFFDVALATDFVRELARSYPLDLSRVVVAGHSAGGHLALWVAGRQRIPATSPLYCVDPLPLHGVVSLAGVSDLLAAWQLNLSSGAVRDLLGGAPERVPERYAEASPAALLPLGVRQALIHGTLDDTVPFSLSKSYSDAAAAQGDPVTLLPLPGAGHFEPIDPSSQEWPLVRECILHLLQ